MNELVKWKLEREQIIALAKEAGCHFPLRSGFGDCRVPQFTNVEELERFAALIQANTVPQWQPIETAPKDGTRILVGGKSPNGNSAYDSVGQAYWRKEIKYAEDSPRCDEPEGFYWASDNKRNGQCCWFISHWQPLPSAPTIQEES